MNIHPKRLTMMLDNAVAVSSEGNKPFPYVTIATSPTGVEVRACGQHILTIEEFGDHNLDSGGIASIRIDEAKAIAAQLRKIDGYARKDREVDVDIRHGVLTITDGEPLVEVVDLDDPDVYEMLDLVDRALCLRQDPDMDGAFVVYDAKILALIGKLKVDDHRVEIIPRYVGYTSRFNLGGCIRGYIEGNRTRPEMIGVAVEDDN